MNTKTKRVGTVTSAVAAVGLIVGGAWGIGAAVGTPEPEPTSVVEPANLERPAADFEDVRPDVTPTPTPTPTEAAPVVEPAPAEPAPAPVAPAAPAPAPAQPAPAPAPAQPAPAPPVSCPSGSTATDIDGAGNAVACMPITAPNGGSCFEGDNGNLPECQNFRP